MDKDSPNLKHVNDLAVHFPPSRIHDSDDNSLPMPQSVSELANCNHSPLKIIRQQDTLDTVLNELVTMDSSISIYSV